MERDLRRSVDARLKITEQLSGGRLKVRSVSIEIICCLKDEAQSFNINIDLLKSIIIIFVVLI